MKTMSIKKGMSAITNITKRTAKLLYCFLIITIAMYLIRPVECLYKATTRACNAFVRRWGEVWVNVWTGGGGSNNSMSVRNLYAVSWEDFIEASTQEESSK